jgi:hypothetical protein
LLTNSTLLTCDVDRTTGFPTEEGQGVTLDSATNTMLLPSANDRFVYGTGYDRTTRNTYEPMQRMRREFRCSRRCRR